MPAHTVKWPPQNLSERVIWWREERNLRQADLARVAGVKLTTLSTIERGLQKSSKILPALAVALEINIHYLSSGKGDPLDLKAQPSPRSVAHILTDKVPRQDMDRLTDVELQLLQFKIREVVREILDSRPRSQKSA